MTLRALPKPDGFELREKRADKACDGRKWLPEDALYDASRQMHDDPPVGAMIVAWYARNEESGNVVLKYRCWHEHDRQTMALAADLVRDL
jgi:hypothetical protein